eukprot:GEMP01079019.1.p1 GENE.GEMP01079019.1~~GEMP01079019.1.p1  ORF type:complete len:249 (+),score=67.36 GEMP01079019.1:97-843(+)
MSLPYLISLHVQWRPLVTAVHPSRPVKSLDSQDAATVFFDLAQNDMVSAFLPSVKVRQDRNTQEHTGGIIWETSYILASYLMEQLTDQPSVLELGAGCGLLGITLAAAKKARSVVVTDQPIALDNLKRNVERNPHKGLSAAALSWGQKELPVDETYDVICGTDVVFNKALVEPLLETIWRVFHATSVAYLLIQDREPQAMRRLEKRAKRYFHEAEEIPIELSNAPLQQAAVDLGCRLYRYRRAKEEPN